MESPSKDPPAEVGNFLLEDITCQQSGSHILMIMQSGVPTVIIAIMFIVFAMPILPSIIAESCKTSRTYLLSSPYPSLKQSRLSLKLAITCYRLETSQPQDLRKANLQDPQSYIGSQATNMFDATRGYGRFLFHKGLRRRSCFLSKT